MPSQSGFYWTVAPTKAFPRAYDNYARRVLDAVYALMLFYAAQMESYAKDNARWADHTGNARSTLFTAVKRNQKNMTLTLAYGVFYGVFLEFSNQGRFAIVAPTLDAHWPRFLNDLKALGR